MMHDPEDDFEQGRGGWAPKEGENVRWWQWPAAIVKGIWALLRGKGDFS